MTSLKSAIISIISLVLFQFFSHYIIYIIAIKLLLIHLILTTSIISLICFKVYYFNSCILYLLWLLNILKHIILYSSTYCISDYYTHYIFRYLLNQLFILQYIIALISYYFNQIEISNIIAIIDRIVRTPCCYVLSHPLAFITYRRTSPKPTNRQTTSCIRPRNHPGGRRALPQNDCAGCAEANKSFSIELHCIWCDPAPNSWTEQNDPCIWLAKWPLHLADSWKSNVQRRAVTWTIIRIISIIRIIQKRKKINLWFFFFTQLLMPLGIEQESTDSLELELTARPNKW